MPQAVSLAATLKLNLGIDSRLVEGHNGIFEVTADGEMVYSNASECGRLPTDEEILEALDKLKK